MSEHTDKRNTAIPMALFAALLMVCAAFVAFSDTSEAAGEDLTGYGDVSEIEIAPGYSWSYTATFPDDLTSGIVLTFAVNELGSLATISGHTVSITIPEGYDSGSYNLVLQADHAASNQTAYQWIRITVNAAMSLDYEGCISEIIAGTAQTITLSSSGGVGTVTWSTISLPDGLTLSGNTIIGTPTTIGVNTIQVRATSSLGQSMDLEIVFTVYNVIVGGAAETITSTGDYVASSAVTQTGADLDVTWAVTDGTLPAGFSLDYSTGIVSGTYTGTTPVEETVTITGISNNGPAQSATKQITVRGEPSFSLDIGSDSTVYVYSGKGDTEITVDVDADVTDITWTVDGPEGVTIDQNGKLTIPDTVSSGTITVTAETEYGQTKTVTITVTVESAISITGPDTLTTTAGVSASAQFTITADTGYTVAITDDGGFGQGVSWDSDSDTLTVSYPEAHTGTVTLTVTSAGGQTTTATIEITVYSGLGFTSEPEFSGIYAYAVDE